MKSVVENAIDWLTETVNLSTGIDHPNDEKKARALFLSLYERGVSLRRSEIVTAARARHWFSGAANQLGALGQDIGDGKPAGIEPNTIWGPMPHALDAWTKEPQ